MSRRRGTDERDGLLPIVQLGDPVLRAEARRLEPSEIGTSELNALIERMRATMTAAPGVGLAAPQIGLGVQLAVVEDPDEFVRNAGDEGAGRTERQVLPFTVLINPRYTPVGDDTRDFFEGCLSMDGYRALVVRHHSVRAHWLDQRGNPHHRVFTGWPARIIQHEIDHLHGTVYVDRMDPRTLVTTEAYVAIWGDLDVSEVRHHLNAPAPTGPAVVAPAT